ncbi:MAG: B12-binding domain-containing radical SAM protein [Planctomycetota bacterium]|jgi:radical SAM superfamily enzyme YgiQ (UPF0313 family)
MVPVVAEPTPGTRVVLLQAPYPGSLKFDSQPSSLLHAVAVYAQRLAREGRVEELGWVDPGVPTPDYRQRLDVVLASPRTRVLLVSTTNAAIEEAAWVVQRARQVRGEGLLVVVGGPHEDDVEEPAAKRISGTNLSLAGDCEFVVDHLLREFETSSLSPAEFSRWFWEQVSAARLKGRVAVSHPELGTKRLELGRIESSDLVPPPWTTKRVRFSVFDAEETLPLLVSRGCSYGRCTFCAEPNQASSRVVYETFDWVRELAASRPGAAIYFQDSIFPKTQAVEEQLLPMLKRLGAPWGAQVYLRALSRSWLEKLREHGCQYIYTGLESASTTVLAGIGKSGFSSDVALERLAWCRELGLRVGISIMFGAIDLNARVLETLGTVAETMALARTISRSGLHVTGFYPNVMTVLAGTQLERALRSRGVRLDFYRMPRAPEFAAFEDGGVGWNYLTMGLLPPEESRALTASIVSAEAALRSCRRPLPQQASDYL